MLSDLPLAPIVLFVFKRPFHTLATLTALKENKYADQSDLFIYSDGPKDFHDQDEVESIREVRSIIRSEKWCKNVYIIEETENKGLARSIRSGISDIISKHDKVIVLEDDIVTSPAFLSYMNKALNFYLYRKTIFFISGYVYPKAVFPIPDDYAYDVFSSVRNSSWGWATWKDRWEQIDWDINAYETIKNNPSIKEALNRGGDDIFKLLDMQQKGLLKIWTIQTTVCQFINHGVTIFPVKSYVDNIGLDGSGENCGSANKLRNFHLNENDSPRFLDILFEDKRIINAFYNVNCIRKRPLWQKAINRLSRILGGKNVFVIKKKVFH